jgi:hypothetical protein
MQNVSSDEATLAQFLQNELVMYVSINKQHVKISKLPGTPSWLCQGTA